MTTRVFKREIYTTPLHGPGPKIKVGKNSVQLSFAGANSAQLSFTGTELYRFEVSIGCNAKFCNF